MYQIWYSRRSCKNDGNLMINKFKEITYIKYKIQMDKFKLKFAGIGEQVINIFEKCGATSEKEVKALDYENMKKVIETKHANWVNMPEIYWENLNSRCNVVLFNVKNPKDAVPYDPDYLICQLSFKLLKDPVLAPSGYTYERGELEKWVNEFHIDPITRNK